jgi:opacity protein-like surface antigen
MKQALLGALAVVLVTWSAAGAAPPMPPSPGNWAGAFAGVEGGFGWANRTGCWNGGAPTVPDCSGLSSFHQFNYNQSGWLGGIQAGYNWQFESNLLFGVEGNFAIANITGTIPSGSSAGVGTWNALGMATGKLGWTNGPLLIYADAGVAAANLDFVGNSGCNFSMGHTGPVAGAGVAWKVTQRVSLDLEYDHIWFDTQATPCTGSHTNDEVVTATNMDLAKVSLDFHLGQ